MSLRSDDLMAKKLANQCSPSEEEELNAWLFEHPSNQKSFDELRKIWEHSEQQTLVVDVDAAWKKVQQKTTAKTIQLPKHIYRYAAAITVFMLLGFWAINLLKPNTVIQTAANQLKQVELPDGSTVWLHEYATLSYKNNLKGSKREVMLEGMAFFDVKRDETRPFVISTPHGEVEVLGTSFEVSAYQNETFERVTVRSGKVKFLQHKGNAVILTANQQAIANKQGKIDTTGVEAEQLVMWTKRELDFNDESLEKVAEKISRYFHVTIKLDNKNIANCHFTGSFKNPNIKQVLDAVCKTLLLEQTQKGQVIILTGAGCKTQ